MINLDPFDPLTEIIESGQAFSFSIALERILWLIIGLFFLGAILIPFARGMSKDNWFLNKLFLSKIKASKSEDNLSDEEK